MPPGGVCITLQVLQLCRSSSALSSAEDRGQELLASCALFRHTLLATALITPGSHACSCRQLRVVAPDHVMAKRNEQGEEMFDRAASAVTA